MAMKIPWFYVQRLFPMGHRCGLASGALCAPGNGVLSRRMHRLRHRDAQLESDESKRQNTLIREKWKAADVTDIALPDRNHLTRIMGTWRCAHSINRRTRR